MEREDLDQIPWSQLAVDADDGIDRRWYGVGIAVGLVIVAILGFRLLAGSGGQPVPAQEVPVAKDEPGSSTTSSQTQPSTPPVAAISESDLRGGDDASLGAIAVAEWFVTDLNTVDGSPETVASLRRLGADAIADHALPHDDPEAERTFVEWARAFDAEVTDSNTATVAVAFRMIREEEGEYARDIVRASEVTLTRTGGHWTVATWPADIDPP